MDGYEITQKATKEVLLEIEKNGLWRCPECKHLMEYPPIDWNICPHCMKEFGYDAKERPEEKPLWIKTVLK